MDRWKAELGRGREKRRVEERRSKKRKSQKKADADARKGRKVAKHSVFPMIWGSGGSKSRLAKAAGEEPAGQMRDEKLHAIVARSTFRSQHVQNTPASDHFWKLRCRKRCRTRSKKVRQSKSKWWTAPHPSPALMYQISLMVLGTTLNSNRAPRKSSSLMWQAILRMKCRGAQSLAPATRSDIWTSKSGPNPWCF